METNRIQQFVVLAQTKHLRKAADVMKMSHGAFHKSMQVLQDEVGMDLYTIQGRSVVITPDGVSFFERAKQFLEAEKLLLKQPTKSEHSFRIATHETFASFLLAPHWKSYLGDTPFVYREVLPGRLEDAVELGIVDVGLTFDHIPRAGLDAILMGHVEKGAYARESICKTKTLAEVPFVAPVLPLETVPSAAKGLDGWPEMKFPRNIVYRSDGLGTAVTLAGEGLCAIFIAHFVAQSYNAHRAKDAHLHPLRLPSLPKVKRDIYLIQRAGSVETPQLRQLAKLIRNEGIAKVGRK